MTKQFWKQFAIDKQQALAITGHVKINAAVWYWNSTSHSFWLGMMWLTNGMWGDKFGFA